MTRRESREAALCLIYEQTFSPEVSTDEIIEKALYNALNDTKRGLGQYGATADEQAIRHLAVMSSGDLRVAYNALELAVLTTKPNAEGKIHLTLKDAEQSIQRKALSYDENMYYDMLSAFCKSLRGSDPDAALYWAHRLISGGCDPLLLARRLVVHSSEDVGMADPNALTVCVSALTALKNIGLPEALIPLSQAIIYVCEAEKSNSVVEAMYSAKEDAIKVKDDNIPAHLKNYEFASKEDKKQKSFSSVLSASPPKAPKPSKLPFLFFQTRFGPVALIP